MTAPARGLPSPAFWVSHDGEWPRRVTWVELFFDLVFVAAVAQVGTPLAQEYTLAGLGRYAFLLAVIWWRGTATRCTPHAVMATTGCSGRSRSRRWWPSSSWPPTPKARSTACPRQGSRPPTR